ncbi:MAG: glycerol kinase GlpK [Bacteroidales bacterium]|nr:glycerol kinase GlpK [Bacteroidales bacterium]MBN2749761.1 glycerol kinase GlpK [Bacteroidales bacterium]
MPDFILSLDQGTSSSRAILFDRFQHQQGVAQKEFAQHYPSLGWVEHNPQELWQSQLDVALEVVAKSRITPSAIAAIGIANQRETTVVWDRETGLPVYNAIVWQDRRTASLCEELKAGGYSQMVQSKTGLVIDSYFSATKLAWLFRNVPGVKQLASKGRLAFGTIDTWLIWKLTGGMVHATDYSNASRTMLFNIETADWDNELLSILGIPRSVLPEVKPSSGIFGYTHPDLFGGISIPILGVAGDQQAALFGQHCYSPGDAKNTYGTGCFMLMNTGTKRVTTQSGLLTTIAWKIGDELTYALEGSVFIAGAAIKWLRDGLGIVKTAAETESMALSVTDSHGVYVVPAFTGLGAPYWDMYARGAIVGLTQGVTAKHIVRATLESLAYQTCDILRLMETHSGINLLSLKADGGASANKFLMQFQSDMLGVDVVCPRFAEATALGAAMLAGIACDFYPQSENLGASPDSTVFSPKMADTQRAALYAGWEKAVGRSRHWAKE